MIDGLKRFATRDHFICDRCGSPDLLLGMYPQCFSCKNTLIKKAISERDRIRFYSIWILNKFISEYDDTIPPSQKAIITGMLQVDLPDFVSMQVKSIFEKYQDIGGNRIGGSIILENGIVRMNILNNYEGDNYKRTIVLLAVSGAVKGMVDFTVPTDAFKVMPREFEEYLYSDNLKWNQRTTLSLYVQLMCDELNKNFFYCLDVVNGETVRREYSVDKDHPEETFLNQITENKKGLEHLSMKGLIRNDICHFCGQLVKTPSPTFTEPVNGFTFSICNNCFSKRP